MESVRKFHNNFVPEKLPLGPRFRRCHVFLSHEMGFPGANSLAVQLLRGERKWSQGWKIAANHGARWWQLKLFFWIFIPIWGNGPIWQAYFSDGLVQPPSSVANHGDFLGVSELIIHLSPCGFKTPCFTRMPADATDRMTWNCSVCNRVSRNKENLKLAQLPRKQPLRR